MIKKLTLNNGLRLVLAPLKEIQSVTILILFKVGSRYESKKLNGVSHFIEHLLFKGTKKRPTALALTKDLDNLGAEYNAFTAKDHTGFYIKVNSEKIEAAIELLTDMLLNSLFAAEEITKERKVIIEEINMFEDNPLLYIEDLYEKICFQGSSLAQIISGSKTNIEKISQEEILNYKNNFYQPQNLVIGLAGKINEEKIKRLISKYLKFNIKKVKLPKFSKFNNKQKAPRLLIKYKETEQVQIAMGFPALKNTDQDLMPLILLSIILGGNMSSRLFTKIREERGLAYFIKSTVNTFEDTGNFFIQAGLTRERIIEALKLIKNELKLIKEKGVTIEELNRAKEFLMGKLILKLEESHSLIQWLAEQWLLTKKIETLEEKLRKIKKVTNQDITKIARKVINFKKLNLAIIGPYKKEADFKNLIK